MATSKEKSSNIIERKAINPSGCLGSLYDGSRDHIIEQPNMRVPRQQSKASKLAKCIVINGSSEASLNLLQTIGIEDDLRLSLLLNLTKRSGIAEVLLHPHCINQYTRFLYYSWISGKEQLLEIEAQFLKFTKTWNCQMNATHMITSITFGIDIVVVLQLPSKAELIDKIDRILKTICGVLLKDKNNTLKLTSDENDSLGEILDTKVYSNIPGFTGLAKVSDILYQIYVIKENSYHRYPLSYTLQLITTIYPSHMRTSVQLSYPLHIKKAASFRPLSASLKGSIEQYMLQFRNSIRYADASLNENISKLLCGHLQHLLNGACIQWSRLKKIYMSEIQRFSKLVIDARSGQTKAVEEIDQVLHDNEGTALKISIDELIRNLNDLETKGQLITNLRQEQFEYWNVEESELNQCDDLGMIKLILIRIDSRNRALCSSDTLNKNNHSKLTKLRRILVEKHKNNPTLRLIYIDFSYSSFSLQDMMILPSDEIDHSENLSKQEASLPTHVPQISSTFSSPPPSTDETINILLLGETGVGKSTFINAFANYLTFNSLEQAQSNEPIVLIPVSFIMTIGDNFEERTIKFGEFDSSNNENFNSVGQSVTQHCKSYVFDLHHMDGKKLRIIDTPGFGDTRGLDQDDHNMEHILQYINNLTHLNAICFLLKPNASRLNIFFRTCFTQLFSLLSPNARQNIIFCFTNGRSTFYTPGDTAPLLKTILKSLSISGIPFEKENTFCFDSESFRYLVALRNEIPFSDGDKHEYEMSWSTSVKESNRLIDHINTKLTVYRMKSGWQSIKHAQFEISHMIRPMLEAMRNILRNIILCEKNLPNELIKLISKPLHHAATCCPSCKSNLHKVGKFWTIVSLPHGIESDCDSCQCSVNQHIPIDYLLNYELSNNFSECDQNQMIDMLNGLRQACAAFAHFFLYIAASTKDDPFFIGLMEMIVEETYICESQKLTHFNKQLVEELTKLKNVHEQRMNKMKVKQEYVELPAIYNSIEIISEYPIVREQMIAVKQTQQLIMEQHEYEAQRI